MNPATDLADCSALTLLALYRSGDVSPVEATRAVLDRIERFNPILNAFCHLAPDEALAAARASEARWRRGAPCGELDGVPVSVKDLILAAGWPTLRGSRTVDPAGPWDVDAPATARLREAGAVILGKTATPEFGCKGETNSPLTGITSNPWNPAKTPGGSSGGTAAAVASGMGPLSVGTDGAGSVRIPAAFCGNFGLKPSFGRVPAYPLSPMGTVAHLGPHAMSVADAALMMNVLKRPDARDWTSLPYDPADYTIGLDDGIRGLRIAFSPTLGYAKVDARSRRRGRRRRRATAGARRARRGGRSRHRRSARDHDRALVRRRARDLERASRRRSRRSPTPTFAPRPSSAQPTARSTCSRLTLRRGALGSHLRQFMQRWDLLATPAIAVPAFDARPAGHSAMTPAAMLGWTPFSYPFNLSQQPACTIPCGLTKDGLPIGLQLVGPMFGDALVLRAARAYESVRPIPRPPPRCPARALESDAVEML